MWSSLRSRFLDFMFHFHDADKTRQWRLAGLNVSRVNAPFSMHHRLLRSDHFPGEVSHTIGQRDSDVGRVAEQTEPLIVAEDG